MTRNHNRIILSVIFTVCFGIVNAQNLKKATITFADNSVKEGFLEYRNWDVAPKAITFKENGSSELKRISSSGILSFIVEDGNTNVQFEKHEIKVETTRMTDVEYFDLQTPEYATQNVLLRLLVKGKVSLYVTFLNNKNVYYVSQNNEIPYELINRSFINKSRIVITDDRYHAQLKKLDCANDKETDRVKYARNELSVLIRNCNNESTVFTENYTKIKNRFGIVAGLDLASNRYTESSPFGNDFSTKINLSAKPGIHIGAFADFMLSKQAKKFSLYLEGAYSQVKNSGNATFSDTKDYNFNVDFNYIK